MLSFSIQYPKFSFTNDLEFRPGLHVIYGESGVGKSWLIHSLAGSNPNGIPNYEIQKQVIPKNIQIVFQNPDNQIVADSIHQELAFAFECNSVDVKWIQDKVNSSAEDLPRKISLDRHPVTLSGGEMEQLNLVTTFGSNPNLIFIDDGLSFLTLKTKQKWVEKIREKIQSKNFIVIWFTSDPSDLDYGDSIWEMTSAFFKKYESKIPLYHKGKNKPAGGMRIQIQDLHFSYENGYELYSGWTSEIQNCRSIGLRGENGSGKTTIARLLSKGLKPDSGDVKLTINHKTPSIALVDQFPERMLGVSSLEFFLDQLIAHEKMDEYHVSTCINVLQEHHIPWDSIKHKYPIDLPWNMIRLAVVILLSNCNYEVLIFDEPTFGLGTEQKQKMINYFNEIMSRKHLVFISHNTNFLASVCDGYIDLTKIEHSLAHDKVQFDDHE